MNKLQCKTMLCLFFIVRYTSVLVADSLKFVGKVVPIISTYQNAQIISFSSLLFQ